MKYEWDSSKEEINIKKHGISFIEAREALQSARLIVLKEDNEQGEERYVFLGLCKKLNVLVVVTAYPDEEEDVIRIISARKANKKERKQYER